MSAPAPAKTRASAWLSSSLLVFVAGWVSLWACAPPSTLPAPIPMSKGEGVLLGGGATLSLVPSHDCRVDEAAAFDTGVPYVPTCAGVLEPMSSLSHWGVVPLTDRWAVGWQLGVGRALPDLVGGVMGRYDFTSSERMLIGTQLEGGPGWGAVGLPVSLQVRDHLWLYTHPSVGFRFNGLARIPLGIGVPVGSRFRIDLEGGVAGPFTDGFTTRYASAWGARRWVSVGLSRTVGR